MDLSFLIAPNDGNFVGIEDEHIPGNCMLKNPISHRFVIQETRRNVTHCSFPQIFADNGGATTGDGCTTAGFHTTIHKQDDDGFPAEPVNVHEEPHILGENQFLVESVSGMEELPVQSLFEANDLIPQSSHDQINNDPHNICSGSEGNQVFSSPIMECGFSMWRTDEGLSTSAIPAGDGHGEKDLHGGETYALPGDCVAKSNHVLGHTVLGLVSKLELEIPCDGLENPTADTEGYLVEITKTLMNDEPFFMDVDAKDVIDKSYFDGLSSLLASSPHNFDQDQSPETEVMASETQDNLAKVSCSRLG